ncbi:hypothetical protein G7Y89_g13117 [Cudoniella acicularis]|uniref:chitin deacetylase n=1 Tax=Cudoniella acicularis TaxID=354080 RepID=A0A8H4R801_9HELO|nr:hypothetical protein G7Y89_g13117 [Cudoniella acicularis]
MPLRVLPHRIRRLALSTFSRAHQLVQPSKPRGKHIKIDDEERGLNEGDYHNHQGSSLARMLRLLLLLLLSLLLITSLLAFVVYRPPPFVISYLQRKYQDVLFHLPLPSDQRVVALTIDDAPSPFTGAILDLLRAHNATATFFVIGSQIAESPSYPALLQRMHDEGHEVGNHAWRDEPSISLPLSELERQVLEVEKLIPANENGRKWFRPGSGFFNQQMVERLAKLGYGVALGSVYPHDAQIQLPRWNARHVLSVVRPGSVIIVHDRRGYSIEQLGIVLEGLARKKWKVVNLGTLVRIKEGLEKGKSG